MKWQDFAKIVCFRGETSDFEGAKTFKKHLTFGWVLIAAFSTTRQEL